MPKKAVDPRTVRSWLHSLGSSTATQYAGHVRRFFRLRRSADLTTVTEAELVDYVLARATKPTRRKTVSAIESFFGFATLKGACVRDPARFLRDAVRKALRERAVLTDLLAAGFPEPALERWLWRDVATHVLGRNKADGQRLSAKAKLLLTTTLLQRLQGVPVEELDALLDTPLVGRLGVIAPVRRSTS